MKKLKEKQLRSLIKRALEKKKISEALTTKAASGKSVGRSRSSATSSRSRDSNKSQGTQQQYTAEVPPGTTTAFPVGDLSGKGKRARITSRSGYRGSVKTPMGTQGNSEHGAYDFGVVVNTPIVAYADGVVTKTSTGGGGGNAVTIRHSFDFPDGKGGSGTATTYYAHLNRIDKSSGAVKAGEVIGLSGNTGASSGPHLHWGIYVNGERVKNDSVYDSALSGATVITNFNTGDNSSGETKSALAESILFKKYKKLSESKISLSSFITEKESISDLENIIDRIVKNEIMKEAIKTSAGKKIGSQAQVVNTKDDSSESPESAQGDAAQIARAEVQAWDGKDESDPSMSDKLTAYWDNAGAPDYQDEQPWSAAFISWAKQNEPGFKKSAAHATYMRDAKRNRDQEKQQGSVAYRTDEAEPQEGDVVCKPRAGSGDGYDNIGAENHCDVYIGGGKMAGGNLGNTAKIVDYDQGSATMIIKNLAESFDLTEDEILEIENILTQE